MTLSPRDRDILTRTHELIQSGWTRETSARDRRGAKVRVSSPKAARYCLSGAIDRAAHELAAPSASSRLWGTLHKVLHELHPEHRGGLLTFNDESPSKHRVLRLVERALEK